MCGNMNNKDSWKCDDSVVLFSSPMTKSRPSCDSVLNEGEITKTTWEEASDLSLDLIKITKAMTQTAKDK
jgi:hypothetical protein